MNISELILVNIQNHLIPGTCQVSRHIKILHRLSRTLRNFMYRNNIESLWISELIYKTMSSNFQVCVTGLWVGQSFEDLPHPIVPQREIKGLFTMGDNRNKKGFNPDLPLVIASIQLVGEFQGRGLVVCLRIVFWKLIAFGLYQNLPHPFWSFSNHHGVPMLVFCWVEDTSVLWRESCSSPLLCFGLQHKTASERTDGISCGWNQVQALLQECT